MSSCARSTSMRRAAGPRSGGGEQAIRVLGGAKSAAALGETEIMARRRAHRYRLREIAEVHDGVAEVRTPRATERPTGHRLRHLQGHAAHRTLASRMPSQAELDKIRAENPDVHIDLDLHHGRAYPAHRIDASLSALIEGSILAVIVVWFFLRSWRATLISALAIPLSAVPTFAFMQWMGFTLNQITLLGAVAGGRRARRRRHRRDREHRAAHAHGQERLSRGSSMRRTRSAWRWSRPRSPSSPCSCRSAS